VYFDEITDPYQVTLLLQLSLFFTATPKVLEEMRANDGRYTREFGIFALAKDGTVAAGHLLMRIPTETTTERLDVGGVNAVATRPDFARRGIMTSIMSETHQYFRDQNLELSFLTTSERLGAMTMYQHLGYVELDRSHVAFKDPGQPRTPTPSAATVRAFSEEDVQDVDRIYREVVTGSYGFIHRPENFLKARKYAAMEIKPKENLRIVLQGDRTTGYAYWDSNPRLSEAHEIIALNRESFHALLAEAERRNPEACVLLWCDGLTSLEIGWLKDAAYQGPLETYGRAVIKNLNRKTDGRKLRLLYGVETEKFRLGLWDET